MFGSDEATVDRSPMASQPAPGSKEAIDQAISPSTCGLGMNMGFVTQGRKIASEEAILNKYLARHTDWRPTTTCQIDTTW